MCLCIAMGEWIMTIRNLHLLIIDPQNDFCDLPAEYCPSHVSERAGVLPALPVPGAHADMLRLAGLVDAAGAGLNQITITLDSHQRLDIAHPGFWQTGAGGPVAPFTQITAADLRAGQFKARDVGAQRRCLDYLEALEAGGRYTHMVWPVHCEMGTWGHNIHADLVRACQRWEDRRGISVNLVLKGLNPWTEHYSAIMAEVPDPQDSATQFNASLMARLRQADRIFIAGEAGSHCVKATCEHIVADLAPQDVRKLVLIEDCMSAVSGFEAQAQAFQAAMRDKGAQLLRSAEVMTELQANTY
jgi:nicotinamidase/pyrazinamidase